jgi:hypothetical protein
MILINCELPGLAIARAAPDRSPKNTGVSQIYKRRSFFPKGGHPFAALSNGGHSHQNRFPNKAICHPNRCFAVMLFALIVFHAQNKTIKNLSDLPIWSMK